MSKLGSLLVASFTICTLSTSLTLANEPTHGEKEAAHEGGHGGGGKVHRDNSALFPPKQADATLSTPPAKTELQTPKFMDKVSGDSTELTWTAVTGADVYHVQVATDPNFKWLKADDHAVKGTSFKVSGLEKGKKYYWRVAGWKTNNMASTNKASFATSLFTVE